MPLSQVVTIAEACNPINRAEKYNFQILILRHPTDGSQMIFEQERRVLIEMLTEIKEDLRKEGVRFGQFRPATKKKKGAV